MDLPVFPPGAVVAVSQWHWDLASKGGANGPNLAIGSSLPNLDATAHGNVAFGGGWRTGLPEDGNLGSNTTGYDNTAIGAGVGISITTGHGNTAIGADSLSELTEGNNNVAIGPQAAEHQTTSSNVIAIGAGALQTNVTGADTIAIGFNALNATTGSFNIAIGTEALKAVTSGANNIALGYRALLNATGSFNVAIGTQACQAATTPNNNTALGYAALTSNETGNSNTAVGFNALTLATAGGGAAVGANAGASITSGARNTCIGAESGYTDGTTATPGTVADVTLIGYRAQATTSNVVVLGKAVATRPNLIFGGVGAAAAFGSGVGVFHIAEAVTVPTGNPTGGGIAYVEGGALKWRSPAGTITTMGAA